jgi:aspartate racemase
MGPEATMAYVAKIIAMTPARCDQEHIPMLIDNNTAVPNRQAAILRGGKDPSDAIAMMGRRLESAGADFLVMPCNSAHAYLDCLLNHTTIPFLSMIDVTTAACAPYQSVGVLATDGCIMSGEYQRALNEIGVRAILPGEKELATIMQAIDSIKAGEMRETTVTRLAVVAQALVDRGAQAVIAGCTEIPLVLSNDAIPAPLIDSTNELAKATVSEALRSPQLKK